jgi:hypothetical protein
MVRFIERCFTQPRPFSVIGSATRTAGGRNRPFALAEERSQLTAVPGGARRPGRSVQETAP